MKGQVGIAGADLLLGDLASLLKEQAGEEVTLARLSDDAFCLMCLPCDEKHMESIAERVRKAVEDHLFDINGKTVPLTVSIGVAAITENSPKAEELMGRAHTASAEVKKLEGHERGNGIVVYNPAQYESLDESNSVEAILKALTTTASGCCSSLSSTCVVRAKSITRPSFACSTKTTRKSLPTTSCPHGAERHGHQD